MKTVIRTTVSYYDDDNRLDEKHVNELTICNEDCLEAEKFYDYLRDVFSNEFGELQTKEWFDNEDIEIG